VNPVIAMLLGVSLGGETVTVYEWWAVAVIMCGVCCSWWPQPEEERGH